MVRIIEGPPRPGDVQPPPGRRWLWFLLIAAGSALVTAMVAYGLEALLPR